MLCAWNLQAQKDKEFPLLRIKFVDFLTPLLVLRLKVLGRWIKPLWAWQETSSNDTNFLTRLVLSFIPYPFAGPFGLLWLERWVPTRILHKTFSLRVNSTFYIDNFLHFTAAPLSCILWLFTIFDTRSGEILLSSILYFLWHWLLNLLLKLHLRKLISKVFSFHFHW